MLQLLWYLFKQWIKNFASAPVFYIEFEFTFWRIIYVSVCKTSGSVLSLISGLFKFFTWYTHCNQIKFSLTPSKLIDYCWHFFLVPLAAWLRGVDFLDVFGFKVKIFTEYRKVFIIGICELKYNIHTNKYLTVWNWFNKWRSESFLSVHDFSLIIIIF